MNWKRLLAGFAILGLAGISLGLGCASNAQIREGLLVERTPISWNVAILPGPAAVQGDVQFADQQLKGPFTSVPCVYYRELVEEEETDSDGNTSWKTIKDVRRSVAFWSVDKTGELRIGTAGADFRGKRVHRSQRGDRRYTEYAIRPKDRVFIFGQFDGRQFSRGDKIPFVVSALGEGQFRSKKGIGALVICLIAIACASFAIYFLCYATNIHLVFVYLTLISITIPSWLFLQWFSLTSAELRFAHAVLQRASAEIDKRPSDTLEAALLKQTYNDGVARYTTYRDRLVNRMVAAIEGVGHLEPHPLSQAELKLAQPFPTPTRPRVRLHPVAGLIFGLIGVAALIGFALVGFRKLLVKRLVENLPTAPAAGVVVGMTELNGTAKREDRWLQSRYAQIPCVWYRYITQEKRGSGKNSRWVTIESGEQSCSFQLADESGSIEVHPAGAKVLGRSSWYEHVGRRKKQEWVVDDQSPTYILGPAKLQSPDDRELSIGQDQFDRNFWIAMRSEREVKLRFARTGFLFANFSLIFGTMAVVCLLALRGFSPFHFFLGGLFPLFYLAVIVVFFLYNDLVFLRERTDRALSMIDVALKKRSDLVPKLVDVAKGYLQHERELQERLAALRIPSGGATVGELTELWLLQSAEIGHFVGVIEAHPELKGNELMLDLQHRLSNIENEIAFARQGYNDAVERYNTRIASFPELLLARLTAMHPTHPFNPDTHQP